MQLKINASYDEFSVDNVRILRMVRTLQELNEIVMVCSWEDTIPDAVMNVLVNSNDSLEKFVGAFHFGLNADELHLQMQQVFREKIVRNDVVKRKWTYNFGYTDDGVSYIDTIEFHKKNE